jgi:uncharacterized protein (DUF1810 family)
LYANKKPLWLSGIMLTLIMDLSRFTEAHQDNFQRALTEISAGQKTSHWMWYVFPQLKALGRSDTAKHYGIANLSEAEAFLTHPILGKNLIEISNALLKLPSNDANQILGSPDDMKLKSSMTLFNELSPPNPIFGKVLTKFFEGRQDEVTLALLK